MQFRSTGILLCAAALWASSNVLAFLADEGQRETLLKVEAEVLDGGVYFLDDKSPLNGLTIGVTIENTLKASETFDASNPQDLGQVLVLKYRKTEDDALDVRKLLDISPDVVLHPEPGRREGYTIAELKSHLDIDQIAARQNVDPQELTASGDLWAKWARDENALSDYWRLGLSIRIPETSPIQYIDFRIIRQETEDDQRIVKALLRQTEKLAYSMRNAPVDSDINDSMRIIPDVIVRRLDSFDVAAAFGQNANAYLDAGEKTAVIPINVGRFYNFMRPGQYSIKTILYGPTNQLQSDDEVNVRVLPFRRTSLSFDELKKDVNERPGGVPLYPWMIYETVSFDGIREVIYSHRRFRLDGSAVHDFYRLCRVSPAASIQVGEKGVYRGIVYTQSDDGHYIHADINFDYRYPLVTMKRMDGETNIPREVSPDGDVSPSID